MQNVSGLEPHLNQMLLSFNKVLYDNYSRYKLIIVFLGWVNLNANFNKSNLSWTHCVSRSHNTRFSTFNIGIDSTLQFRVTTRVVGSTVPAIPATGRWTMFPHTVIVTLTLRAHCSPCDSLASSVRLSKETPQSVTPDHSPNYRSICQ